MPFRVLNRKRAYEVDPPKPKTGLRLLNPKIFHEADPKPNGCRAARDEVLEKLKENERRPWTNEDYNEGVHDTLEGVYTMLGGKPSFKGYLEAHETLDSYPSGPPAQKEPAPLTRLKVGDLVHVDIGSWRELGDYAKVIGVSGDQITVEGIEPGKQNRKTFGETHFLTFGMGVSYGSGNEPREDYHFHFVMKPPEDILAFGLKPVENATGGDEFTKHYGLFNYYAPAAEFRGKEQAFAAKLREHHYYSPHGLFLDEVFRDVKGLPRKAWETETRKPLPWDLRPVRFQPPLQPISKPMVRSGVGGSAPWYDRAAYCRKCRQLYRVPEEWRMKRLYCQKCGGQLRRSSPLAAHEADPGLTWTAINSLGHTLTGVEIDHRRSRTYQDDNSSKLTLRTNGTFTINPGWGFPNVAHETGGTD